MVAVIFPLFLAPLVRDFPNIQDKNFSYAKDYLWKNLLYLKIPSAATVR